MGDRDALRPIYTLIIALTATAAWAGETYIERHGDVTYVHPLPK
jgi:hypothetical protein